MRAASIAAFAALTIASQLAHANPRPKDVTGSDFALRVKSAALEARQAPRRWAETTPEVILTPRFMYVRDRALSLPAPPWFGEGAYAAAFELARSAWYSTQPDRVRLIMVFSTFADGGDALFYLAMANDVAGLGEGQPAELFDDTPDTTLDGYAWLGDVGILESAGDAYFREAFIHEIAHRWCSYAIIAKPGIARDLLLGRQGMHWSFLADTQTSPMEGNAWEARGDDVYVTVFDTPPELRFSPLDLYLMGVLPPERVPPFMVIDAFTVIEPPNMNISKESPPAHRSGNPVSLKVSSLIEVSIDEVIAGSGPRSPAASEDPVVWPVGIVLLSNGIEKTHLEELVRLDQHIAELTHDFERATGGRITLDVRVEGAGTEDFGVPCTQVDDCNRTRSDRCEPIRKGGTPVCTRSCTMDQECGLGFCCGTLADPKTATSMLCLAGSRCTRAMAMDPGMEIDRPPAPPEPQPEPGMLEHAGTSGCSCASTQRPREGAAIAFVLLGFSAARRRSWRRRCSRGG